MGLTHHDLRHQRGAAFEYAVGLCDAERAGCALDLDADDRAAHRGVGGADPVVVSRRKLDAGAVDPLELAVAFADRERVDLGAVLLAGQREAGPRPRPAREAVRNSTGDE